MALLFRRFLIVVAVFSLTTFRSAAKQYDGLVEVRELPLSRLRLGAELKTSPEYLFDDDQSSKGQRSEGLLLSRNMRKRHCWDVTDLCCMWSTC